MKVKLFTHTDLDGVGCGILARLAFQKEVIIRYNSLSALNREIDSFLEQKQQSHFLFITDLSPNEENEQKLNDYFQEKGNIQLIDHHKTALHLNDYKWGYVVVEDEQAHLTSATSLFYDYLVTHEMLEKTEIVTEFVELVRQYDTWEWEKNHNYKAHQLNTLFFLMSIDEFEEKMVARLQKNNHFDFDEFEQKLLDLEDEKRERYIRRKKRELVQKEVEEKFVGIIYAESYHSELGNELGKEHPHLDYIAIINIGAKRIAFRTIHEHVDVSEIASRFGGGGHAKAAGCSLSNEAYKLFVEETYHLEPIQTDAKRNRYNVKESSFGTLYTNHKENEFLLHPFNEYEWRIEKNKATLEERFSSFLEAETFLKRRYTAWLAKDERFVKYLMKEAKRNI